MRRRRGIKASFAAFYPDSPSFSIGIANATHHAILTCATSASGAPAYTHTVGTDSLDIVHMKQIEEFRGKSVRSGTRSEKCRMALADDQHDGRPWSKRLRKLTNCCTQQSENVRLTRYHSPSLVLTQPFNARKTSRKKCIDVFGKSSGVARIVRMFRTYQTLQFLAPSCCACTT